VATLCRRHQPPPAGGILHAQRQYHGSCCISPYNRWIAVSSSFLSLLIYIPILESCPTATIHWNGLVGYVLPLGLQCNQWRYTIKCCAPRIFHSSGVFRPPMPLSCSIWGVLSTSESTLCQLDYRTHNSSPSKVWKLKEFKDFNCHHFPLAGGRCIWIGWHFLPDLVLNSAALKTQLVERVIILAIYMHSHTHVDHLFSVWDVFNAWYPPFMRVWFPLCST
jgi:hypothetical protein